MERVFRKFDANGDGRISRPELAALFDSLGHAATEDELTRMMAEADADGDGLLCEAEFLELAQQASWAGVEEGDDELRTRAPREAFGMYASSSTEATMTTMITPASLRRMLGKLLGAEKMGLEECRAMICRFDLNGDGVLSFDEFRVMMMANL